MLPITLLTLFAGILQPTGSQQEAHQAPYARIVLGHPYAPFSPAITPSGDGEIILTWTFIPPQGDPPPEGYLITSYRVTTGKSGSPVRSGVRYIFVLEGTTASDLPGRGVFEYTITPISNWEAHPLWNTTFRPRLSQPQPSP